MSIAVPATYFDNVPTQSSAASEVGKTLFQLLVNASSHARDNATDWRPLARAYIEEVAQECGSDGWDGYGAKAISPVTKEQAQALIDMFPFSFAMPEVLPDPDGEIALCWDLGPGRVFTTTVGSSGLVSYAGILGNGEKPHGVEPIKGKIPKPVIEALDKLLSQD
jgi:hypothetical protein